MHARSFKGKRAVGGGVADGIEKSSFIGWNFHLHTDEEQRISSASVVMRSIAFFSDTTTRRIRSAAAAGKKLDCMHKEALYCSDLSRLDSASTNMTFAGGAKNCLSGPNHFMRYSTVHKVFLASECLFFFLW